MTPTRTLPRVHVMGWSNSGKTTLIEQLVPRIQAHGVRVATLKHAHHGFEIDRDGSDSWRHRHAGAQAVVVAGPDGWAMQQRGSVDAPTVASMLGVRDEADLLLVEGGLDTTDAATILLPGGREPLPSEPASAQLLVEAHPATLDDEQLDRIAAFCIAQATRCALVLAGGASSRFSPDHDKLLALVEGRTLLERVITTCHRAGFAHVLAAIDPASAAAARIDALDRLAVGIVHDAPIDGPIGGLSAAVDALSRECTSVLVLAADIPFIDTATIASVVGVLGVGNTLPHAVVAVDDDGVDQPACMAWSVAALRAALHAVTTTARTAGRGPSLRALLEHERSTRGSAAVATVQLPPRSQALHDVDTPDDLAAARDAAHEQDHTP